MKPRLPMDTIYEAAAESFRLAGELRPSLCDVRCTVNDLLDAYEKDGYAVNPGSVLI